MAAIDYSTRDALKFQDNVGRHYQVGPGRIEGDLRLFVFALPGATEDTEGFFRLTFEFCAADNQRYRYSNLFGPQLLWIPPNVAGQKTRSNLPPVAIEVAAELDHRETYTVRYDDGTVLNSRFYYTGVKWVLHEPQDAVIPVCMTWYYLETASMHTIYYDLDVRQLLWRGAPTYGEGGSVTFENADFVGIELVGTRVTTDAPTEISVEGKRQ